MLFFDENYQANMHKKRLEEAAKEGPTASVVLTLGRPEPKEHTYIPPTSNSRIIKAVNESDSILALK